MSKTPEYAFNRPATIARMARILDLLQEPHTKLELAEATHIGKNAMQAYLNALLAVPRRIRVVDWRPNSPGSPTPVYMVGDARDAAKPKPMTSLQRTRRHRANAEVRMREAARRRGQRMRPQRDPAAAALFGPA